MNKSKFEKWYKRKVKQLRKYKRWDSVDFLYVHKNDIRYVFNAGLRTKK